MTARELRDELTRIADSAPQVHVPDDTFTRGRRSLARSRAMVGVAVAASLALIGGLALGGAFTGDRAPVATDRGGVGVPDHLYAVPGHVTGNRETDLALGQAAAVFLTPSGVPVLVDAARGGYHLLDLDGLRSQDSDLSPVQAWDPSIALSPDGRSLAWGWIDPADDARSGVTGGIRIADLETGEVREVVPASADPVLVDHVDWSANSRWLAWTGSRIQTMTETSLSTDGSVAGAVPPGSDTTTITRVDGPEIRNGDELTVTGDGPLAAVSDRGDLAVVSGNLLVHGKERTRFALGDQGVADLWFQGNRVLALIHQDGDTTLAMALERADGPKRVVFTTTGSARVLGVFASGAVAVIREHPQDEAPTRVDAIAPIEDSTEVSESALVEVDADIGSLSVATDLIDETSLKHPTLTRPEPDWPWTWQRKALVFGGIGLGIGAVLLGGWWVRRRSTPGSPSHGKP